MLNLAFLIVGAVLFGAGVYFGNSLNQQEQPKPKMKRKPFFNYGDLLDPVTPKEQRAYSNEERGV